MSRFPGPVEYMQNPARAFRDRRQRMAEAFAQLPEDASIKRAAHFPRTHTVIVGGRQVGSGIWRGSAAVDVAEGARSRLRSV